MLSREGPLEPDRALSLVGQVGAALDAAHATGLVHRDVKPAQHPHRGRRSRLPHRLRPVEVHVAATSGPTASGEFLGTVAYVAPEQIEGLAADHRADVYSLTCLLYECLTGATPYVRDSDLAVLWAHVDEEPPRLSATRPELGAALDGVVARGLAKRPDERYGTCSELTAAASSAMRRRTRAELPAELDAYTPLTDREEELGWLRDAWSLARTGSATLVVLAGVRGMGKTRVAAELAGEVHAQGATVRYVGFAGPSPPTGEAVARLVDATEPTLLVLDDLDAADSSVIDQLAALIRSTSGRSLLVLGTYRPEAEARALAGLLGQLSDASVRELLPFDRDGVTRVAALYLGGSTAELSVDAVLATTGGIPARVHEVVSEWARGEASRRLAEAADRAAMGHSDLLTAAVALESNVIDLQRVHERTSLYAPGGDELDPVLCPFKGLASFEMDDAHVFFGRERLVAELVARLVGSPLLGIVGPSGSGKSSVVRAGLMPALTAGILPGSERWRRVLLRPGDQPMAALNEALEAIENDRDGDGHVLVVVDQFEETFTACRDDAERAAFVSAITAAARNPRGRFSVVLAIRASFYGRCAAYPDLAALLGTNHVLVGPMQPEELRRAIELPARRAGLRVEPRLVDALVADVGDEPGALPLLSTALLELWQERDGRTLRLERYEASGGIRGAVGRLAEGAYARLSEPQQGVARSILLRLSSGEAEGSVRRRAALSEFDLDANEDARVVLAELTDSRLLTVSEGTVEVAHEALLREWPRLRGWLEDNVSGRRLHEHLMRSARTWEEAGREPAELYRGARLASAVDWRAEHQTELNELERQFLEASRDAEQGELQVARKRTRRLRVLAIMLAVLLVAAVVSALLAVRQTQRTNDQRELAQARQLASQSVANLDSRLDLALLLALEAYRTRPVAEARSALVTATQQSGRVTAVLSGHRSELTDVAFSPDGATLATVDGDGTVRLWDGETGRPRTDALEGTAVSFSPEGDTLVIGHDDGTLTFRDVASGAVVAEAVDTGVGPIGAVEWSPTGETLAVFGAAEPESAPTFRLIDATSRQPVDETLPAPQSVVGTSFTPDDQTLVIASGFEGVSRWDVARGESIGEPFGVNFEAGELLTRMAMSPDGTTLALATLSPSGSALVALWELASQTPVGEPIRPRDPVSSLAFGPDGTTLAIGSEDASLTVWDVATLQPRLEPMEGHGGPVTAVAFSPDGTTLASGSSDGSALLRDVSTPRPNAQLLLAPPVEAGPPPFVSDIAFNPDGSLIAAATSVPAPPGESPPAGSGIRLWDAGSGEPVGVVLEGGAVEPVVAFGADGKLLAGSTASETVELWDVAGGRTAGSALQEADMYIRDVDVSPDGALLAAVRSERIPGPDARSDVVTLGEPEVRLWALDSFEPMGEPFAVGATHVVFSPDGRGLFVADGRLRLWDTSGSPQSEQAVDAAGVTQFAFSSDGTRLATFGIDGMILWELANAWDLAGASRLGEPIQAHRGAVTSASFSPDGSVLATAGDDGTLKLWDVAARRELGEPIPYAGVPSTTLAFSPDGRTLASAGDPAVALLLWDDVLWASDVRAFEEQLCPIAGRNLTRSEWNEFLPDQDYRKTCDQFPLEPAAG